MTPALAGLLDESQRRGFIGPGSIDGHVRHALAFAEAASSPPERALDLGAGGGLPGLVLAATAWPSASWCLLDAQLRRVTFLREAVEALGLSARVDVVARRAEDHGRVEAERFEYDLVVARSFGPPSTVVECAAPLLRLGGQLVVSEPPAATMAARWPSPHLADLGLGAAEAVIATSEGEDPVHLVCIRRVGPVPDRYPRRVGVPAKRPLF